MREWTSPIPLCPGVFCGNATIPTVLSPNQTQAEAEAEPGVPAVPGCQEGTKRGRCPPCPAASVWCRAGRAWLSRLHRVSRSPRGSAHLLAAQNQLAGSPIHLWGTNVALRSGTVSQLSILRERGSFCFVWKFEFPFLHVQDGRVPVGTLGATKSKPPPNHVKLFPLHQQQSHVYTAIEESFHEAFSHKRPRLPGEHLRRV